MDEGHEAQLIFAGSDLKVVWARVVALLAREVSLTCVDLDTPLEEETSCILVIRRPRSVVRAAAVVTEVSGSSVRLHLRTPLRNPDRRSSGRAVVPVRLMLRKLERLAPFTSHLSLVPPDGRFRVELAELSATGMRVRMVEPLSPGDLLEVRLHVPGVGGGEHFVLHGEVVRRVEGDAVLRWGELKSELLERLARLVDGVRSGLNLSAW